MLRIRRPALPAAVIRTALVLCVLPVGSTRNALAQAISGQVVDSLSGVGIAGGYVLLLDSAGRELARTLSDGRGGFELRAPGPGTYRLGARRIGFRPAVSADLTLSATPVTGYRLAVSSIPVALGAVVVEGKPRCGGSGDDGSGLAAVWGQAREALAAVSWTSKAPYLYHLNLFERALDEFGRTVLRERISSRTGYYQTPFKSAPPEDLVRDGYVVGTQLNRVYFGPDAPVLLSDAFVSSHCFSLARDPKDPRVVGLAFKPASRHVPEIQGTLWVDRQTAELRSFSYGYVNLPPDLPENVAGGEARFLRLPSGAWIIERWSIRNPIMRRSYTFGGAPVYSLAAVQETGGQVLEVTNARRDRVYLADAALLEGTVFDSVANAPLAGATVKLLGTDLSATTDGSGQFQLEASLEGEYRVTFEHPGIDSLGFTLPPVTVSLAKGHPAELRLSTVGETGIMARLCPGPPSSEGQGIVLGTVRDDSGHPLGGIRLSATWFDAGATENSLAAAGRGLELVTDSTGGYLLCGVPVHARMVLRLEGAHGVRVETVGLGSHRIAVGGKEYVTRARAIWRHDVLAGPGGAPATVVATVTDTLGGAVPNAVVSLLGTQAVGVSDRRGRVALPGVPPGSNLLAVRRLGYQPLDRVVEVPPADSLTLARGVLALAPLPVMLDTAVVTGRVEDRMLKLSGFYDRQKEGMGDFITRADFEKNYPVSVYDILRRLAAINVRPNAARYNDARNGPMWLLISRRLGWRGSPGDNVNALKACAMQVYLNGTRLGDGFSVELDDVLSLNDIEAVEAYDGGADVPPEFNATGSECGVVAIWTRR